MDPTILKNNQKQLFDLMSTFACETLIGCVSGAYLKYGNVIVAGDSLALILIPFLEAYFNNCAHMLESRNDEYLNKKFDEMTAIELPNKNHRVDVLQLIVIITLNALKTMDIKDVITDLHETSMIAAQCHIKALLKRFEHLSSKLLGCDNTHIHLPIDVNEKVFTFTTDKYTDTPSGPVKLSVL